MLAVLSKEPGADKVVEVYKKAASGEASLIMHKLNLLEVYYGLFREYGKAHSEKFIRRSVKLRTLGRGYKEHPRSCGYLLVLVFWPLLLFYILSNDFNRCAATTPSEITWRPQMTAP
jgi:hypothetical protein